MTESQIDNSASMPIETQFKDYRLTNVYGRLDPTTAQSIIGLWLLNGVLPPAEAQRRATEVVYTVCNPQGELVGVNTVYTAARPDDGLSYYFYRTYIRPDSRGVFGLPRTMLRLTIDYLRGHTGTQGPSGLIIVTENPKLMRRSVTTIAGKLGLHLLGKDARGCEVWGLNFDGSTPRGVTPAPTK